MHLLRITGLVFHYHYLLFFVLIPFNLLSENQKNQTKEVTKYRNSMS